MAILCHCHGVNERKVRRAVERGARTIDEIGETCQAGTTCGGCWPSLEGVLRSAGVAPGAPPHCSPAIAAG